MHSVVSGHICFGTEFHKIFPQLFVNKRFPDFSQESKCDNITCARGVGIHGCQLRNANLFQVETREQLRCQSNCKFLRPSLTQWVSERTAQSDWHPRCLVNVLSCRGYSLGGGMLRTGLCSGAVRLVARGLRGHGVNLHLAVARSLPHRSAERVLEHVRVTNATSHNRQIRKLVETWQINKLKTIRKAVSTFAVIIDVNKPKIAMELIFQTAPSWNEFSLRQSSS